jgi:hypothetical protein
MVRRFYFWNNSLSLQRDIGIDQLFHQQAFLVTKFGSPAVKNGSLGRQASAIFNPCHAGG